MRCTKITLFFLLAAGAFCGAARGHGFKISLVNDQITALTDDIPILFNNLFQEGFALTDPGNSFSTLFSNHGSVDAHAAGSGFVVHSTPQAGDDSFHFDVVSPLFYSNGGPASPTPVGVKLNIQKSAALSIDVTGQTAAVPGFDIIGFSTHETNKYLNDWASVGEGLYGFAYIASGHNAQGHSFVPSIPLIVVFSTPGFTDPQLQEAGAGEIYAVVPEPCSLTLFAAGAVLALVTASRRRRSN